MTVSYSLSYFETCFHYLLRFPLLFLGEIIYNYFGYLVVLWHIRSIGIFFQKSSHFSRKSLIISKEFPIFTSNFHYVKIFFPEILYLHQFRFLFGIIFAIDTITLFKASFSCIFREISLISRSFQLRFPIDPNLVFRSIPPQI